MLSPTNSLRTMEINPKNELSFAVKLALIVTAVLLMCKYTAYSWSSSLCHQHSALFVTSKCPIDLYTIKKFATVSSLLSYIIIYEHFHLTRRRKKFTHLQAYSCGQWINQREQCKFPCYPLGYRKSDEQYLERFACGSLLTHSVVLSSFY